MSQFYQGVTAGSLPPTVPTSFVTQNGTATPLANVLIINAFDSSENNDNGIISKGGVAGTGTVNEVDIDLTNRVTGQVTTTDATPTTIITFNLGVTAGVFYAEGNLQGYDITDVAAGCYSFAGAVRTDGATGTEIGSELKNIYEDTAMINSDFSFVVSGNNANLVVTGLAGKTINWNSLFTYRFIG